MMSDIWENDDIINDDAWEDYTDEKVEHLERQLDQTRRLRYWRSQGYTYKKIVELGTELGFVGRTGRRLLIGSLSVSLGDVEIEPGHNNGGWQRTLRPSTKHGFQAQRDRQASGFVTWQQFNEYVQLEEIKRKAREARLSELQASPEREADFYKRRDARLEAHSKFYNTRSQQTKLVEGDHGDD
tara:strand:- start:755 stop:1306 length:552 start_codon:yes stop_codon:yes gene_type:complete